MSVGPAVAKLADEPGRDVDYPQPSRPESPTLRESKRMPDDLDKTNILIVDDLPEKVLVYRTILEDLGQNLVFARSGEEALRAVLKNEFAVILLDVQMPGMNGFETAALIRSRKKSALTPIIFVTAFGDEVRQSEGYAQGAVDYILSPVVPEILRAKVRVFVDLYRMTQQVRRQA
jgi:CheY-like chemotaxis protein